MMTAVIRRTSGLFRARRVIALIAIVLAALSRSPGPALAQQLGLCGPSGNTIACENTLPGNPESEWDLAGGTSDPSIQGFATAMSVNRGQTVQFKIKTTASVYRLDIYRLGCYGGLGARKMGTVSRSTAQTQPDCLTHFSTGLIDCGSWEVSLSWAVPATATSGIYVAKAHPDAPRFVASNESLLCELNDLAASLRGA